MQLKIYHIALISFFLLNMANCVYSQVLNSKGTINNSGTIKVKGVLQTQDKGKIENTGEIQISGNAFIVQDSIGGKVVYNRSDNSTWQIVPQLHYQNVFFEGTTPKRIDPDDNRPFYALNQFVSSPNTRINIEQNRHIYTKGMVEHNGTINWASNFGKIVLVGNTPQDIFGAGTFKELKLDNTNGADVINGGGFQVRNLLELSNGEFRNSDSNNFIVGDNATLIRNTNASIAYEPIYEGNVTINYVGAGAIATGAEIPNNTDVLTNLYVENIGGITASKDITVSDSIYVGSDIRTNDYTLTLKGEYNPYFNPNNPSVEIVGNFKRTKITDGDTILFNNPYTYALFANSTAKGNISEITIGVWKGLYPLLNVLDIDDTKVRRRINIEAKDETGNIVDSGFDMEFGYGWRHAPGEVYDESNNLAITDVVFQNSDGVNWNPIFSNQDNVLLNNRWVRNSVKISNQLNGYYALGLPGSFLNLVFRAKIFLEGAYRTRQKDYMAVDLWEKKLLYNASIDEYPLNLLSDFDPTLVSIPDSVVDWVVVEFRKDFNGIEPSVFKPALVKNDGTIIAVDGTPFIRLGEKDNLEQNETNFHIVIRHRNHASIITELIDLNSDEIKGNVLDFTRWNQYLFSGMSILKVIDITSNDENIYGMRGGFFGKSEIDLFETSENDQIQVWQQFNYTGYILGDYNLSGIITTKDYNISWNNRKN